MERCGPTRIQWIGMIFPCPEGNGPHIIGLVATVQLKVQFPIPAERSLLDFLFPKQEVQCRPDNVRTLSKLCCQIVLANHHVPGWVTAMDSAPIA
jgi:hypothetical protein